MPRRALVQRETFKNARLHRAMLAKHASPIVALINIATSLGLSPEDASDYVNANYTDNVDVVLRQCVDHFFKPGPRGAFFEGRFNKPTLPCLYSSIDERTAAIEKLHYLCKDAKVGPTIGLATFCMRANGEFWDTTAVTDPEVRGLLQKDEWDYCQKVGDLAKDDSDGVKAQSARCDGVNVATYRRVALNTEGIVGVYHLDRARAKSPIPADVFETRT